MSSDFISLNSRFFFLISRIRQTKWKTQKMQKTKPEKTVLFPSTFAFFLCQKILFSVKLFFTIYFLLKLIFLVKLKINFQNMFFTVSYLNREWLESIWMKVFLVQKGKKEKLNGKNVLVGKNNMVFTSHRNVLEKEH